MRADGGDSLSYSSDAGGSVSTGGGGTGGSSGGGSSGGESTSGGSASPFGPGGGDAGAVAAGLIPGGQDDPRIYGYSNALDPVSSAQLYNQLFGSAGGKSPFVIQTAQPESAASRIGVGIAIALGSALVYFVFKKKGGQHAGTVD